MGALRAGWLKFGLTAQATYLGWNLARSGVKARGRDSDWTSAVPSCVVVIDVSGLVEALLLRMVAKLEVTRAAMMVSAMAAKRFMMVSFWVGEIYRMAAIDGLIAPSCLR